VPWSPALAQSPDIKNRRQRIEAAQAMIEQAGAAWMPQ